MHIQASAFPLIKPAHLLEFSITAEGSLCVHANSTWARIPPEWSNSILIYSNLNLSKRADARVTSTQLVGGGGSVVSLSQILHSGLPDSDDMRYEGRAHAFCFLLFSTYLLCLGALSKSHFPSLSVFPYLYEHAGLWESAVSGGAAQVWPRGAVGAL